MWVESGKWAIGGHGVGDRQTDIKTRRLARTQCCTSTNQTTSFPASPDIDRNLYRSRHLWLPLGARGVFGGQVIGQSLVAMSRTVASGFVVHSLHCYFVLPGDPSIPIVYSVDRIRDGASFCTRRVRAAQRDRTIFVSSASFQLTAAKKQVPGTVVLEYQSSMPSVPQPEELPTSEEQLQRVLKDAESIPKHLHSLLSQRMQEPLPFEFKPVGRGWG